MKQDDEEIKDAEFLRCLDSLVDCWENKDLELDDMADHLEGANAVISGEITFSEFIDKYKLKKIFDA